MIARLFLFLCILTTLPLRGQTSLDRGKELLQVGKYREAVSVLRQIIDAAPRNADAWRLLGEAYLRLENLDSAELASRRAVSIDDERPEAYILLSQVLVSRKQPLEGISTLRRAIKAKVVTSPLLTQLGFILLSTDSIDQAIVAFSQAKEVDPNNGLAYEGLGDAYVKQGVPAVAIFQYEKGAEVDSMRPSIYYKLANAYYKERRYTDAARAYRNVLRLDPTNAKAQLELGRLYYLAKLYADAAAVLKSYVKNPDANGEAMMMYMEALFYSRQYEDALATAEKLLKTHPTSVRALRIAAHAYTELKKHDKAIASFDHLSKIDTLRADDFRRLARSYIDMKRDSLAAATLEQAIQLDSTELELYSDLGATYMRLRKYDRAAAAFEKRFQKESVPLRAVGAYLNYGACMMALEKWEQARWAYRTALGIYPQYIPAYNRLALSLSQLDSLDEAKNVYEITLAMTDTVQDKNKYKTEITDAHQQIGFINLRQKKYQDALEFLSRADKLRPNDLQTVLWLAQTYHLLNKPDEACREYKRVLKLDSKNEAAKKGVELLQCE